MKSLRLVAVVAAMFFALESARPAPAAARGFDFPPCVWGCVGAAGTCWAGGGGSSCLIYFEGCVAGCGLV